MKITISIGASLAMKCGSDDFIVRVCECVQVSASAWVRASACECVSACKCVKKRERGEIEEIRLERNTCFCNLRIKVSFQSKYYC